MKHTPTPWKMSDLWHVIVDSNGKWVADTVTVHRLNEEEAANADLIVRAVNSHDALVESVKALLVCMRLANWEGDDAAIQARAALTAAGEQS